MILIASREVTRAQYDENKSLESLFYKTEFWKLYQIGPKSFAVQAQYSGVGDYFLSETRATLDEAMALLPKVPANTKVFIGGGDWVYFSAHADNKAREWKVRKHFSGYGGRCASYSDILDCASESEARAAEIAMTADAARAALKEVA